jgi:hypothetical protein
LFNAAAQTDTTKLIFAFIANLRTRQKTVKPTWVVNAPSDHHPQKGLHAHGFGNLPGVHKGVSAVKSVPRICE